MLQNFKRVDAPQSAPISTAPMSDPLSVAVDLRDHEALDLVRHALRHKQVKLAYQPVVQTANPDQMAFYEGLLRVHDSSGRVIPAKSFIDAVEDTEMGRILDALALEKGLEVLAAEPGLRLAINMSARSIAYPGWKQVLDRGLQDNPTVGERLILEITERTAITMPDLVQVFMAELQQKGISFALDDFGAGFTSFRYLRDFYFDILKIDGEFIRGIHQNADNQILTDAMLSLARHFDMFTVAESVESHLDASYLASIGVDCMQGFYFGAPTINPYWQRAP